MEATPSLDWLLLTKRPQNVVRLAPSWWWHGGFPENVWIGTTVENQEEADRRIPHLLSAPAKVRFLSCEPLLGPVDLRGICGETERDDYFPLEHIDWAIVGGESGPGARPMHPDWARVLRDQCAGAGVPFFFKQWSGRTSAEIKAKGRELDGVVHDGYPALPERRQP